MSFPLFFLMIMVVAAVLTIIAELLHFFGLSILLSFAIVSILFVLYVENFV